MRRYIIRRLLLLVPGLLAVYTITFVVMHATPGGPWDTSEKPLSAEVIANLNHQYHLDDPLWKQYLDYLWGVVRYGDFGPSYFNPNMSVSDIIVHFWPVSIQLGLVAMAFALLMGLGLGVISAVYHNRWLDYAATFCSIIGISTPVYVVVTLLILVFAVDLHWVPTGGWDGLFSNRVWIPALALAVGPGALLARYTRSSMLEVVCQDYIRTARAKGLGERVVIVRHALKNALIPVTTVAGIAFARVITGSFFVETIATVPGLGRYFVNSINGRDYPVLMGTVLLYAFVIALMNLAVDIAYAFLDPRVRYT